MAVPCAWGGRRPGRLAAESQDASPTLLPQPLLCVSKGPLQVGVFSARSDIVASFSVLGISNIKEFSAQKSMMM